MDMGLGALAASYKVPEARKKPKTPRSWMHTIKKFLVETNWNWTKPADFVPWHEEKEVKDWLAAQMPGPGFHVHLCPLAGQATATTSTMEPIT